MDYFASYLSYLQTKGGPDKDDYYDLDAIIIDLVDQIKKARIQIPSATVGVSPNAA